MSSVHILRVNAPDQQTNLCLLNLQPNDRLLLVDDGCYCLTSHFINKVLEIIEPTQCYAIKTHIVARGLQNQTQKINQISYQTSLKLLFDANNVITWQ